jgi:hypothetical protein
MNPYFFPTFQDHIGKNRPGTTPDIGNSDQRWDWVEKVMLPQYQKLEMNEGMHKIFLRDRINEGKELCPNVDDK